MSNDSEGVVPVEEQVAQLKGEVQAIRRDLNSLPDSLEKAFQAYDKTVLERFQNKAEGKGIIDVVIEAIKAGTASGTDKYSEEVSGMAKQIVAMALRATLSDMKKKLGVPDHVTVE